jgi:hypothetical protein
MLKSREDAYELLKVLGASDRLFRHAQLVGHAADLLLVELQAIGVKCDAGSVELGAVLHDAGKINHPKEFSEPGSQHEEAGQVLLLAHGVQPEAARCCVSHGAWNFPDVTLEERIVALADKLWKGKREAELELSLIDEVALRLGVSRWDVFERLDTKFEQIAADGAERVQGSRSD